jgi:hypothetical protein
MKPVIIGLYGEAGAGKDASAKFIHEWATNNQKSNFGYFSFAEPVYALTAVILGTTSEKLAEREQKETPQWFSVTASNLERARDTYCSYGLDSYEEFSDIWPIFEDKCLDKHDADFENQDALYMLYISPRRMLQLVGTELGRDLINENVWLLTLLKKINIAVPDVAVVTDVRFPNEVNFIANSNHENVTSFVLEIQRPENPHKTKTVHASEQRLDPSKIKEVIINDSTLETLRLKVQEACTKHAK